MKPSPFCARRSGRAAMVVVIILTVLAAGFAAWYFLIRKPSVAKDLDLVPRNAAGFVSVRVSDLWEGETMKGFRSDVGEFMKKVGQEATRGGGVQDPMAMIQQMESRIGMKLTDIERVTLVVPSMDDLMGKPNVWGIVLSKVDYDQDKITTTLRATKTKKVNGKEYHFSRDFGIYFVDSRIAIIGEPKGVETFLKTDTKKDGPLDNSLRLASGDHHLVAGFAIPQSFKDQMKQELDPQNPQAKMVSSLLGVEAATLTMDLTADLKLSMTADFSNGDDAKAAHSALNEGLAQAKQMVAREMPKDFPEMNKTVTKVMNSIKTEQKGDSVEVSMTIEKVREMVKGLLGPAVQKVREAAARSESQNNLKQLTLALHNYAFEHNDQFPPAVITDKQGKPLYSWRVAILPYIEEQALYNELKKDEPWDSPHNIKLLSKMPKVFQHPAAKAIQPGRTVYQMFTGPGTLNQKGRKLSLTQITNVDGTSNTIAIAEAKKAVAWSAPEDIVCSKQVDPRTLLGTYFGQNYQVGMCDGSVRSVPATISEATMRHAIDPADGNVLGADW